MIFFKYVQRIANVAKTLKRKSNIGLKKMCQLTNYLQVQKQRALFGVHNAQLFRNDC